MLLCSFISISVTQLDSVHSFSIYLQTEYTITCYVTMGEGTYMDKWMDRLYY